MRADAKRNFVMEIVKLKVVLEMAEKMQGSKKVCSKK